MCTRAPGGKEMKTESAESLGDDAIRLDAAAIHRHLVVLLLTTDGDVAFWNKRAILETGIPAAAAVGQNVAAFLAMEEDQQRMIELLATITMEQEGDQVAECESSFTSALSAKAHRFRFTRGDGVNRAHLELTVTGGRTPGIVLAVGVPCEDREWQFGYARWLLEQEG
eukprot:gene40155-18571_t